MRIIGYLLMSLIIIFEIFILKNLFNIVINDFRCHLIVNPTKVFHHLRTKTVIFMKCKKSIRDLYNPNNDKQNYPLICSLY